MSINSINTNPSFKGFIIMPINKRASASFDTNKILKIETRNNGDETLITYDLPNQVKHNGYTYKEPSVFAVNYDMNTILNAYNATKNTNLTVDLSEYKIK